jgi:hypothetical protein
MLILFSWWAPFYYVLVYEFQRFKSIRISSAGKITDQDFTAGRVVVNRCRLAGQVQKRFKGLRFLDWNLHFNGMNTMVVTGSLSGNQLRIKDHHWNHPEICQIYKCKGREFVRVQHAQGFYHSGDDRRPGVNGRTEGSSIKYIPPISDARRAFDFGARQRAECRVPSASPRPLQLVGQR